MKSFISTILTFALFPLFVSADRKMGGAEGMTNMAEAEWVGVVVAILIITIAIIISRIIRKIKTKKI